MRFWTKQLKAIGARIARQPTAEHSLAQGAGIKRRSTPDELRQMVLRVGVIREGRVVSERLVPKRRSVLLGHLTDEAFLSQLGLVPGFEIFSCRKGAYFLRFDEKMSGKVWLGPNPFTLDGLRAPGRALQHGKSWVIPIDSRVRGKLEIGTLAILFHFVPGKTKAESLAPPYDPYAPLFDRRQLARVVAPIAVISIVIHLILYGVLSLRTPGKEDPEHWVDIEMSLPEEEEPEQEQPEQNEPDPDDVVVPPEMAEQILTEAPPEEQRAERPPETELARALTPEARREQARAQVRQETMLGAFGGPAGEALPDVFNVTDTQVGWVMGGQQARGDGGLASLGVGGSVFGGEGAATPASVNVSAPVGVARQAATRVEASEERERVRVTSEVRQSEARTAGAGRVENLSTELRRRVRDIERCYERALPDDPDLGGRINLQFDINENGRVEDAILAENEVGDTVGDCILREVRQWRFDPPEGGTLTVRKAYLLQPSGD